MIDRRRFIETAGLVALAGSMLPGAAIARALRERLPTRAIPSSGEELPIIGLGNSNAFREGDLATSKDVIARLLDAGGRYIDCRGPSSFVVAEAVKSLDAVGDVFLGTYFAAADAPAAVLDARKLLDLTGKPSLDLMHNYPEDAVPHWDTFREWKAAGMTRHIGVSRHVREAYPAMMKLMQTRTVDILQVNYSLLEPEAEERMLPMAQDLGVAVTVNRPFINGRWFEIVRGRELPGWAADFDCTSWAQFSLKFILSHPAVTCVLTETANPSHALDNLSAGFGRLPDPAERRRMRDYVNGLL